MDDENLGEILNSRAQTSNTTGGGPTASSEEQASIDDTLANINKNMSTMADILQKMYTSASSQPLRGKRPRGNKRSRANSDDSEHELGQSESDSSTTQTERKRPRRRCSDDEISLEAGDLENDLAELQSSTQTSQVTCYDAGGNHANGISQF